jgi:hypothetical protein
MSTTGKGQRGRNVLRLRRKSVQRIEYEEIQKWEMAFEDEIESYPQLDRKRNIFQLVKDFLVGLCAAITANKI